MGGKYLSKMFIAWNCKTWCLNNKTHILNIMARNKTSYFPPFRASVKFFMHLPICFSLFLVIILYATYNITYDATYNTLSPYCTTYEQNKTKYIIAPLLLQPSVCRKKFKSFSRDCKDFSLTFVNLLRLHHFLRFSSYRMNPLMRTVPWFLLVSEKSRFLLWTSLLAQNFHKFLYPQTLQPHGTTHRLLNSLLQSSTCRAARCISITHWAHSFMTALMLLHVWSLPAYITFGLIIWIWGIHTYLRL